MTGLNASQTSLTNWAAGGENTVAGNLYVNIDANYLKDKWSWDNGLRTDFGLTYTTANKWNKSVDKIELFTKAGYEIGKHWYGSALFTFLSQYAKGYEKPSDHLTRPLHGDWCVFCLLIHCIIGSYFVYLSIKNSIIFLPWHTNPRIPMNM